MKAKYITITVVLLAIGLIASAQPAPPTTPYGNPVPVGELVSLLSIGLLGFGAYKLRKKK